MSQAEEYTNGRAEHVEVHRLPDGFTSWVAVANHWKRRYETQKAENEVLMRQLERDREQRRAAQRKLQDVSRELERLRVR